MLLGVVLESMRSLLDLLALVLLLGSVVLELLGQVLYLRRVLTARGGGLDLREGGLIEAAELQLVLLRMIQQLRCTRGCRIQRVEMLLIRRRWRRWIMRHLGQHPVFNLEL